MVVSSSAPIDKPEIERDHFARQFVLVQRAFLS